MVHEALLREWPRLRIWLDGSRDDVRLQRLLGAGAAEWLAANQHEGFLLRGSRLDQFAGWAETSTMALTGDERAFLEASLAERHVREAEEEDRRQRELETAQQLAETETARAEEQTQAAGRLRRRAVFLTGALVMAVVLALAAIFFARQSDQSAAAAQESEARAVISAATATVAQGEAVTQAELAATRAAEAQEQRSVAEEQRALAQEQRAIAEDEADARATAEVIAIQEREEAERLANLAIARELASLALANIEADPESSILLALQSLDTTYTLEGEEALRQGLPASRVRMTLAGEHQDVTDIAYSPDGATVATLGFDGTQPSAIVWDAVTGEALLTVPSAADNCPGFVSGACAVTLAFSPNGKLLAMEDADNDVLILDLEASLAAGAVQSLGRLSGHTAYIHDMNFSPDGTRLVTISEDQSVKIWDLDSGDPLYSLDVPVFWSYASSIFSPDGSLLAISPTGQGYEGGVLLLNPETGEPILTVPVIFGNALFTPDMARLITADNEDVSIRVYDLQTSLAEGSAHEIFAHSEGSTIAGLSPGLDGTLLALPESHTVVWAVGEDNLEELMTLSGASNAQLASFSPDNRNLLTSGDDGTAQIWDITAAGNSEYLTLAGHSTHVHDTTVSPDGSKIASASWDGTVRIWNAETGEPLLTIDAHDGWALQVAFSPDGSRLVSAGADTTVRVWDAVTGQELAVLSGHEEGLVGGFFPGVLSATFSPDGSLIATGGADGTVRTWDATTYQPLDTVTVHPNDLGVTQVRFSPDGTRLAATTDGLLEDDPAVVKVWDLASGEVIMEQATPMTQILFGLAYSPDGERVATSGFDGHAKVWDLRTGDELLSLAAPDSSIVRLAYSPDGKRLATSSGDGTARLWDAANGELLGSFTGDGGFVGGIAFSPDGSRLVTGEDDGTVRVYLLELEELMALARTRATRLLTDEECRQYLHLDVCSPES